MGINGASRGAQAGQSGGFDAAIRREPGTPDVPKAGFAESELAIGFDAFVPLAPDDFLPEFEGVFGFEEVGLPDDFGKDVEIVNLAEHVLEALEIVAPGGIVLGQKVLDGVAEALQSNTHRVPGFGFFRAQGFGVKIPGGFESFEREAFGGETPSRHEARALAQSALEALPGFLIEFVRHAERVLSQTRFVRFERSLQMRTDGVGFGGELLYPLVHYLSIAKRAESAKEFARDLAHGRPGGIGVHLFHHRRDGPAAANGHAKIVDGTRVGRRAEVFHFLDNAVHPKGKTAVLRAGTGGKRCDGSHVQPRKSARLSSLRGNPCRTGP